MSECKKVTITGGVKQHKEFYDTNMDDFMDVSVEKTENEFEPIMFDINDIDQISLTDEQSENKLTEDILEPMEDIPVDIPDIDDIYETETEISEEPELSEKSEDMDGGGEIYDKVQLDVKQISN